MVTILKPGAGEIITWWSKVFTQCPPYATVLWFFYEVCCTGYEYLFLETMPLDVVLIWYIPKWLLMKAIKTQSCRWYKFIPNRSFSLKIWNVGALFGPTVLLIQKAYFSQFASTKVPNYSYSETHKLLQSFTQILTYEHTLIIIHSYTKAITG